MRAPYYVEVLSQNKEVLNRRQVDMLPIRIGRGYDNDVILDDPHISPHHATVEENADGGLTIRDLGSRNGIIHNGSRRTEMLIDGNTIVRLGRITLRVRYSDFPVADEIADSTSHEWEGWRPALAGLAMVVVVTGISSWLEDTQKFEAARHLLPIFVILVLGMLWCGIWSFANRLFGGHARLGRHLFIFGCGLAVMECWGLLSSTVAYSLSLELFTRYGSHVVIAIFAAMIFFHLLNIKPYRSRRFAVICVSLAVVGSGLKLVSNYHSNGRLADELFMHERLPTVLRLSPNRPVSRMMSNAAKLKVTVDEERGKAISGDEVECDD